MGKKRTGTKRSGPVSWVGKSVLLGGLIGAGLCALAAALVMGGVIPQEGLMTAGRCAALLGAVDLRLYGEGAEGAVGRSRQWVYGGLRADGESALRGTDPNATAVARRGGGSGFACDVLPTATEKTEVSRKMKALRHELAK